MFRIKTDIRQYRCESRDRVERLIRNWVIRPSDQIWDDDADDWQPIGDHPAFEELFVSLSEQHENQPETVVTDSVADKAATDRALASNSSPRRTANGSTGANMRRRPVRSSSSAGSSGGTPQPPEPSEDVVGVIRDSDEITLVTDRTRALRIQQRGDESIAVDAGEVAPDEPTLRVDRSSVREARGVEVAAGEPTNRIDRPEFEDAPDPPGGADGEPVAEDEPTDQFQRPDFDDLQSPTPEATGRAAPDEPTERIERPDFQEQAPSRSRSGEPAEGVEIADELVDTDEIVDDETEELQIGDEVLADTDEIEQPEHQESTPADGKTPKSADSSASQRLRLEQTLLATRPEIAHRRCLQIEAVPAEQPEGESDEPVDDSQQASPGGHQAIPVADEPVEQDPIPTPGLDDDQEELPEVGVTPVDEEDDEQWPEVGVTPVDEEEDEQLPEVDIDPVEDEVVDGYDVDIPITIGPSAEAVKAGIRKTSASTRTRTRLYPPPERKSPGQVVTAEYNMEPDPLDELIERLPVDRPTAIVVAAAVVFLGLMVVVLVAL